MATQSIAHLVVKETKVSNVFKVTQIYPNLDSKSSYKAAGAITTDLRKRKQFKNFR